MNNTQLLITFTRNPELGKVKTRLAKTIGDQLALKTYEELMRHTAKTIKKFNCDKAIYYSEAIIKDDIWTDEYATKHLQTGIDLGSRMATAFEQGFKDGYQNIIIVGSDLFDLKTNHISEAFQKLSKSDIVIGPALDGGYYLLGMKTLHKSVFLNKNWGTSTVYKDTLKDIEHLNLSHIETLNDIDTYEDLISNKKLKKRILENDK
ncbi:MAG: glycosyltransferase [Bacteroidetes bacterium MedPE-SWsnd-G2]|nr:MAG: glycosyltransferase [Bacteroidetes bacterium MedPE-SWsnd-G2]